MASRTRRHRCLSGAPPSGSCHRSSRKSKFNFVINQLHIHKQSSWSGCNSLTSSQLESMTPSGSMPAGPSYFLSSWGRSEFHSSFLEISLMIKFCKNKVMIRSPRLKQRILCEYRSAVGGTSLKTGLTTGTGKMTHGGQIATHWESIKSINNSKGSLQI